MLRDTVERWSVQDATELYELTRWGQGYFSVGDNGHLLVHPNRQAERAIDVPELVERLQLRGLDPPILLRFNGILEDRLQQIQRAFAQAIEEHNYSGRYRCVFPIKVNQQQQVVEKIIEYSRPLGFGLEAGSKPELLAVLAMTDAETPVVCNGFKDAEFIEMAMLAQKIGRNVIPVVEKYTELRLILECAAQVGVRPRLGMRVKLATRGTGRWRDSAGLRSKFGLSAGELLEGLDLLQHLEMPDCFRLLHFHVGSQVTNIRYIKNALIEAARVYVELVKRGAGLQYLDVGGGLGVDYDGSQTNFESSVNYSLQEYANDVVYYIQTVCDDAGVEHPDLISESGRAIAAYHSVLVFGVLGVAAQGNRDELPDSLESVEQPLRTLSETYHSITPRNVLEAFHDAQSALDMAMNLFSTGYLPLDQRAQAENMYWMICRKISRLVDQLDRRPEELEGLDRILSSTYFCNFSLFQSVPDSWAIKQVFPIIPIHRLDERPTQHAVIGDITCDSDGKIDQFIDRRHVKRTLLLHEVDTSPYLLGAFLVGAYQEILGDLHNLFGDTNAAHVDLLDNGEVALESIIKGDTVHEVLQYVQFGRRDLIHSLQRAVESAVQDGHINHSEAGRIVKFYESALSGYTYLEKPEERL